MDWLRSAIAFMWCFYSVALDVSVNVLHGHKLNSPNLTLALRFVLFFEAQHKETKCQCIARA